MKSLLIKQVKPEIGRDTKTFRAYFDVGGQPLRGESLGITASTTGHSLSAIRGCAAKAFIKIYEPTAERDEIETRIAIETLRTPYVWRARLQPKNQ